jgi:hypothetical protein
MHCCGALRRHAKSCVSAGMEVTVDERMRREEVLQPSGLPCLLLWGSAQPASGGLRSGGVLATVAHLHIGQLGMLVAVWLAWHRLGVAEPEAPGARLADRPAAGDDTPVWPWRRGRRQRDPGRWRRPRGSEPGRPRRQRCGGMGRRGRPSERQVAERGAGQRRQSGTGGPARRTWARRRPFAVTADRRRPRRQVQPVCLANNGILRHAQPAADFSGRVTLGPEFAQPDYDFVGPLHLVVLPPERTTRYGRSEVGLNIRSGGQPQKVVDNYDARPKL